MLPSEQEILAFLDQASTKPLKVRELARSLNVSSHEHGALRALLHDMAARGLVYSTKGQRFARPERLNLLVGRLQVVRSGAGFVVLDDRSEPDVFVPAFRLAGAVHGDRVVVRVEKRPAGSNPEGHVIRVLERARQQLVGTFRRSRRFGHVRPDDPKLAFDVYVTPDEGVRPEEGQKVVVQVDSWGDDHTSPEGTIVEVLGWPDDPGVDVLSILYDHGLDPTFPEEVERDARRLPARIPPAELARRVDLRDRLVVTIDPDNARDFDDALSIQAVGQDWEVGIHVADATHYLEPGSALDEEARRRATSVYLVDRVVPMLPERLSNELCSLNPDVDRLAFSVLVTLDAHGRVQASRLAETVIRSRARLTYGEAQRLLDGERLPGRGPEIGEAVRRLRDLSRELRAARTERGSLDFDLPEAEVVLDEEGFPLDIQESARLESHRLIEEFMLLANELVARRAQKRRVPFVYRVHEEPDPLKIENLRRFAAAFGHVVPPGEVTPRVLQRTLARAEGTPEEKVLNTVVLRSMKQARYSTENVGHFGLASECYTHFTSPIRRYSDVLVHRVLKRLERDAGRAADDRDEERRELARLAEHASARERVAAEAERDSIDLKKVEFMERHVGETFAGTISGVQAFGFFVRLQRWFVEGLVHVNTLEDDYYVFDETHYSLVGRNTARAFRLGDLVDVRIARVDREARQIDLLLEESAAGTRRGERGRASRPARSPRRADDGAARRGPRGGTGRAEGGGARRRGAPPASSDGAPPRPQTPAASRRGGEPPKRGPSRRGGRRRGGRR